MKVNNDGSVYMVEVLSEMQDLGKLQEKLINMVKTLKQNGIQASGEVVSTTGEKIK